MTRGGEGKLPVDTLLRMLGDASRSPSIRSGGGFVVRELYRPNDFCHFLLTSSVIDVRNYKLYSKLIYAAYICYMLYLDKKNVENFILKGS